MGSKAWHPHLHRQFKNAAARWPAGERLHDASARKSWRSHAGDRTPKPSLGYQVIEGYGRRPERRVNGMNRKETFLAALTQ